MILRVRDRDGNIVGIPSMRGPKGDPGTGSGDMTAADYDPQGKKTDVFKYVDDQIGDIAAILDSINGEVV